MGNINISITEEAYNFLKMLKGKDKSFSDIILEIKEDSNKCTGRGLLKYWGKLKESNWDEIEKGMKNFRKSFNKRM